MRLIEVTEESRTKKLSEDDFLWKSTSQIKLGIDKYKEGFYITRALRKIETEGESSILLSNPLNTNRISTTGLQYYTWLIDESPYWGDYPKRNKSLICSSSIYNTYNESLYVVLPMGNPTIGICDEGDIWDSFNYLQDIGIKSLHVFNVIMTYIFDNQTPPINDRSIKTFEQFADAVSNIKPFDYVISDRVSQERYDTIVTKWTNMPNLLDYLFKIFKPEINGFTKTDLSSYSLSNVKQEVWFSTPAVLIKKGLLDDYIDNDMV